MDPRLAAGLLSPCGLRFRDLAFQPGLRSREIPQRQRATTHRPPRRAGRHRARPAHHFDGRMAIGMGAAQENDIAHGSAPQVEWGIVGDGR